MRSMKFYIHGTFLLLLPILCGCHWSWRELSENEIASCEKAISNSFRSDANLFELPPREDRYWISSADDANKITLFDLRNRNFTYNFVFSPQADGSLRLISEKGFFDSDKYFPHSPERMTRSDYITYKYSYDSKKFNYLNYVSQIWTPGYRMQSAVKDISLENALETVKRWNALTPRVDSSKWRKSL